MDIKSHLVVCGFLPLASILALTQVSRHWHCVCCSDQLWTELCKRNHFHTVAIARRTTAKDLYRTQSLQSLTLLRLHSNQLHLYNVRKARYFPSITLEKPLHIDDFRLVSLPDDSFMLIGGTVSAWEVSSQVLWIHRDGSVLSLRNLVEARSAPGVIYYANQVYVFGGEAGELLRSGECLPIKSVSNMIHRLWNPLREMYQPRANFVPVGVGQRVYLCGGCSRRIEAFDVVEECFFQLNVLLPKSCAWDCVSSHLNHLLILSDSEMLLWSAGASHYTTFPLTSHGHSLTNQMPPIVYNHQLHYFDCDNCVKTIPLPEDCI